MTTRRFSTADLENLTEGTTQTPWRHYRDHGIISLEGEESMPVATDLFPQDADLLAAAPDLAAELLRLRTELEERIRVWQKVADKLEASGDTDVAEVMRHVGRSAARILNGDTHE